MRLVLQALEKLHSPAVKRIATAGVKKQWGDAKWETGRSKSLAPPPAFSLSSALYWWSLLVISAGKAEMWFAES